MNKQFRVLRQNLVLTILVTILLVSCAQGGDVPLPDAGGVPNELVLLCTLDSSGDCPADGLIPLWGEFLSTRGVRSCRDDADCAFLPPTNLSYDCGCSYGDDIWGKDGTAVNRSYADEAEVFNQAFQSDACAAYREMCAPRICDGEPRNGAYCSQGVCYIESSECGEPCGISEWEPPAGCR